MICMNSVLVVGAGPSGLTVAAECRKNGWKTTVIEEHAEIGKPIHCTGIISVDGVKETGLDVESITLNKVVGARIFSPQNEEMTVKRNEPVAYIVERDKLDKLLAQKAIQAGVEIRTETSLLDIRKETVFVQKKGRGEMLKANVIVGADGPFSKTRGIMGVSLPKEKFVHAYQFRVKGHFEKNLVQVHLGSYAKNYFAWVAPENEEMARVGLAVSDGNVRKSFEEFEKKLGFEGEKCDMCSALIPCGEPFREIVKDNIMLVGDAAFQTKATTGGGIITGMMAGKACAKTIDSYFRDKKPLSDYWKNVSGLNKELVLHWKIRKYLNSLSEEKTNDLVSKMKKAEMEEFLSKYGHMDKPSKFIGKIYKSPGILRMLPEAVKFFMS